MDKYYIFIIILIVIITLVIIYLLYNDKQIIHQGGQLRGKVKRQRLLNENKHIIVDGLNLLYHHFKGMEKMIRKNDILPSVRIMMNELIPKLRRKFKGRIMIVFKNKESIPYTDQQKEAYKKLAATHNIYIYLCQDYPKSKYSIHSSMGRDDFYGAVLARLYKCRILSYDKYHDFEHFVYEVGNFQVYHIFPDIREPHRLISINAFDYAKEIYKPYTYTLEDIEQMI